jgi:hypothetical protein
MRRIGNVTFEDDALPLSVQTWLQDRREKRLGIGVMRVLKQLSPIRNLDDLSEIHNRDAVRQMLNDRQVLAYE